MAEMTGTVLTQNNKQRDQLETLKGQQFAFTWKNDISEIETVTLSQKHEGWVIRLNKGSGIPATDAEVWMWLKILELKKTIRELEAKLK